MYTFWFWQVKNKKKIGNDKQSRYVTLHLLQVKNAIMNAHYDSVDVLWFIKPQLYELDSLVSRGTDTEFF